MKSPFPGMDPYLEDRWPTVHANLITFIQEVLQPKLPSALRARSEERLLVEEADEDRQVYQADVAVLQSTGSQNAPPASAIATIEPIAITLEESDIYERSVQIIDIKTGNRIVTAIEVLSPWNKLPGRLNAKYLKKLGDYRQAGVNIVEIDLLRSSRDQMPITHQSIPKRRRSTYLTCAYFAQPRRWFAYPMPLREPLGAIPIPLRPQDQAVALEMQPILERVYAAGAHDDIDYSAPLNPPLSPEDAAWAQETIRAAKRS